MDINQLSQVIGAVGAILSFVLVVWGSLKNKMEIFNLSKKSRVQRHLLSYGAIYSLFGEVRESLIGVMMLIAPNNVLKAYSLWSVSKLFLLYLLWISFVGIHEKVLDLYYGLLVAIVYFSWLVFLFWSFVFSQFNVIKKSIPENLTFDALQTAGGSAYLIYVFSAFGLVGIFSAYYLDNLLDMQWDWKSILIISFGITVISVMLFRESLLADNWKCKSKLFLMLVAMMSSLITQFDISLSKVSDSIKIWTFTVFILEFILIGLITSKIESNLASLLWKLKMREKETATPWIQISTKDGGTIKGFLFDFLDDNYLILKEGRCYRAISWKELDPDGITVCGDILYDYMREDF
ncbi:hypothetical protein [Thermococcus sp.]|uniref:hypothetical protein n=1 Tax=Thermococcus sp. TaxID=35749 RepID=UPI0025F521E1|nr:hypothetical protein [Thermococcus sp.]